MTESDRPTQRVEPLPGEDNWPAETILDEADRITLGPRPRDYAHPLENHARISVLWNAYLLARYGNEPHGITAEDVAWMQIFVKVARDMETPKRDNLVDVAGYARCLERMRAKKGEDGYVK